MKIVIRKFLCYELCLLNILSESKGNWYGLSNFMHGIWGQMYSYLFISKLLTKLACT